jgi:hypothetical protein
LHHASAVISTKELARAVMAWRRLKLDRAAFVTFQILGYDDDPREIWEIEEVPIRRTG